MRFPVWAVRTAALALVLGGLVLAIGSSGATVPGTATPVVEAAAVEIGVATWYGADYEGSTTACGQIYKTAEYTAASNTLASNTLPCGSVVTVTNLDTGAAVTLTVTDRGAFTYPIVVDLSVAAFSTIGDLDDGVVRVAVSS